MHKEVPKGYIEIYEDNLIYFIDSLRYFKESVFTLLSVWGSLYFLPDIDETQSTDDVKKQTFILAWDKAIPWNFPKK